MIYCLHFECNKFIAHRLRLTLIKIDFCGFQQNYFGACSLVSSVFELLKRSVWVAIKLNCSIALRIIMWLLGIHNHMSRFITAIYIIPLVTADSKIPIKRINFETHTIRVIVCVIWLKSQSDWHSFDLVSCQIKFEPIIVRLKLYRIRKVNYFRLLFNRE